MSASTVTTQISGTASEPSSSIRTGDGGPYRVWDLRVRGDDGPVAVHVGSWFDGALHDGQRLVVSGKRAAQGDGHVEAQSITDRETGATFTAHHRSLASAVELTGNAAHPFDLSQGDDVEGYAFDLRTDDGNLHTVVLAGRKLRGRVADGHRLRVTGRLDAGNVLRAVQADDLSDNSRVTVAPAVPRPVLVLLSTVFLLLSAAVPWIAVHSASGPGHSGDAGPAPLIVWSALCGLLIIFSAWQLLRTRR